MGQPITDSISGSPLDVTETYPGVNQDVREDPEPDQIDFGFVSTTLSGHMLDNQNKYLRASLSVFFKASRKLKVAVRCAK